MIGKRKYVDNFAMFTLFHWFLTENLIMDMSSFAVDIILQVKRNADKQPLQKGIDILFISLSFLIILFKLSLILTYMFIFGKPSSSKFFLFDGIHP